MVASYDWKNSLWLEPGNLVGAMGPPLAEGSLSSSDQVWQDVGYACPPNNSLLAKQNPDSMTEVPDMPDAIHYEDPQTLVSQMQPEHFLASLESSSSDCTLPSEPILYPSVLYTPDFYKYNGPVNWPIEIASPDGKPIRNSQQQNQDLSRSRDEIWGTFLEVRKKMPPLKNCKLSDTGPMPNRSLPGGWFRFFFCNQIELSPTWWMMPRGHYKPNSFQKWNPRWLPHAECYYIPEGFFYNSRTHKCYKVPSGYLVPDNNDPEDERLFPSSTNHRPEKYKNQKSFHAKS